MAKIAETPLMLQYLEMKKKHPDAILLFRVGDFYETFSDDAVAASEILGITLTRRANGAAQSVELAGFPHHALDSYLPKLVRAGRRVAICEQLEDPKLTKKLVKRGITELVTPGVNTSAGALQARENNFLAALHFGRNGATGLALLDISTGEFICTQAPEKEADRLLSSFRPKELLRMKGTRERYEKNFAYRCSVFELDDWVYTADSSEERLRSQFDTATLKGFGVDGMPEAIVAAASILRYLDITSHLQISHITTLSRLDNSRYLHMDPFTVRNLELTESLSHGGTSLLQVLDKTVCPMGSRMLARWLLMPLVEKKEIDRRLDCVQAFSADAVLHTRATEATRQTGDLERLGSRAATRRIGPRETVALAAGLKGAMTLRDILRACGCKPLTALGTEMPDVADIACLIDKTLLPDTPTQLGKAPAVAPGVDTELDELRALLSSGRRALDDITAREVQRTGIASLKIGFNNVFGYYLEVRNTYRNKVPREWIRKQTLVSAERYITPELKEYEEKISGAEERIAVIESRIFNELLDSVNTRFADLHATAAAVAQTDCLLSFAAAAVDYGYVRPQIDGSLSLAITGGRHPVIERTLPPGEGYVANSVSLDSDTRQIMMITGPNMSGKSALLRQTALIAVMAQAGSFVPAASAQIGIVDKIFTRVGASDSLSTGESTFMVEMNEAASILNNMSQRSLILFDELGRGTSTYDGISIAWAIVEHIHENGRCRPKTLFATHYHELNEMEKSFPRISNFNVSVKEIGGKVVFLRRLEKGGSAHSFGIHVARLAGMPPSIVRRANQVLAQLEEGAPSAAGTGHAVGRDTLGALAKSRDGFQTSIFQLDDPLLSQIRDRLLDVSIDNLTPIQALNILSDLQGLLTGK